MTKHKILALLLSLLLLTSLITSFSVAFASDSIGEEKAPDPTTDLIPEEDTLYNRLMASSSLEEVKAIWEAATEEERDALSDEQKEEIKQFFAAFIDSENTPPTDPIPEEDTLFDRLMASLSLDEAEAILEAASPDEIDTLSDEQKEAIDQHIAAFILEPPEELLPDAKKLRDSFMKMQSQAEIEAFLLRLSETEQEALVKILSEEDIMLVAKQCGLILDEVVHTPAKNYTNVGPLMPPFEASPHKGMMSPLGAGDPEDNGLELSKTASLNIDGSYKITLGAYSTGEVTSSQVPVPTDIVLVLDESAIMKEPLHEYVQVYVLDQSNTYYVKSGDSYVAVKWCKGGIFKTHDPGWFTGSHFFVHWGDEYKPMTSASDTTAGHVQFYSRGDTNETKGDALEAAASAFVGSVYIDAVNNNVDHRIAVVGFSNENQASIKEGLNNDIRNRGQNVLNAISGLNNSGNNNYIDDGMVKAKSAFDTAPTPLSQGVRNRVVVVFTGGIPGTNNSWNNTVANNAIVAAKTLKDSPYHATIFTVGLIDGANPELPISEETNNDARINKFLHYLSSNFPNASSMTSSGSGNIAGGYFLSASDAESFNLIFEKIAQQIATPTKPMGEGTVVDIVSQYFNAPAASDVSLYTSEYNGTSFAAKIALDSSSGVSATVTDDKITVSGFNFDENFVSDKGRGTPLFYGKKLIIEFTISPKAGFLGGNGVPTNEAQSGIYDENNRLVQAFEVPGVDVPIPNVSVSAQDKNVYLTNSLSDADLLSGATATAGTGVNQTTFTLSLAGDSFVLSVADEWKGDFVNLTTTVNRPTGVNASTPLMADTTYSVSFEIASKTAGTSVAKSATSSPASKINVFKPELTFKDSDVNYGGAVPTSFSDNFESEIWKHGNSTDTGITMVDTKPVLTLSYTPETSKLGKIDAADTGGNVVISKQDVGVEVTVKIGNTDVSNYTSFKHQTCQGQTCSVTAPYRFLLHVNTANLTISKTGGAADESYVFTVCRNGKKYTELTIVGNDSATIYELPNGNYTITEDMKWSWRYLTPTFKYDNNTNATYSDITDSNRAGTVTCTNSLPKTNWLNAFSNIIKNIFATP